jgi:peptidyl-prolyl cis-trans isomerase C
MTRILQHSTCIAALGLLLALTPFPARAIAPDSTPAALNDPVIASGTGFTVTRSQLEDAFVNVIATQAANGRPIPDEDRAEVRSNLLDRLVINQILLKKATADDKSSTRQKIDEAIATARKNAPSPEAFDAQIKASGMTLDQFRDRAVDQEICNRVLMREITNGITVSDAEVQKFYDDNPTDFQRPEEVRAAHILISTQDPLTHQPISADLKKAKKELAQQLKARAEKGEDFAALAKQYSDDPGSKDKGGEYTFPRGKMVPEFEAAAFSLKINQISDPVETQYGYHIIKLLEKIPPTKQSFPAAQPAIRDYLVQKQAKMALPAYVAKLKADNNVKFVDSSAK